MRLKVDDLAVDYGGGEVVRGVSLHVDAGEFVAVIGPNGAGKTSLLNAIAGVVPASRGTVWHDDENVTGRPLDVRARNGIVLVPENRGLIADMSVDDHLWLGNHRRPDRAVLQTVHDLFPRLTERGKTKAGKLSGGEAQMLAIATAILLRPRTLLIDELSFGLAPVLVAELLDRCARLAREQDVAVVIVEQFVELALKASDRTVVLSQGVIRVEGPSSEVAERRDELEAAYLHYGA
jgi:branched-chain amino acid transport system ATP-binding protein